MKDCLQYIKQAAIEAWKAQKPADAVFGTVISISPFLVRIDSNLILSSNLLIVPEHVINAVQNGDRLVLLRKTGGQKYIVIGRIL